MQTGIGQKGFIALMAVLIISVMLLGVSFTRSNNAFFSRFSTLDSEYKRISLGLAESCINVALLKISQNYNYVPTSGGEIVSVNPSATPLTSCIIKDVTYDTTNEATLHQKIATISSQAEYKGTWSNTKVSATIQDPNAALVVRGNLIVVVDVQTGGAYNAGDFDITVSPTSLSPSPSTFHGTASGTVVYLNPGTYNVSITSKPGYTQILKGNCSGPILSGETKTCTIKENYTSPTATLTLIADVINNNTGTKLPANFPLFIDGNPTSSGALVKNLSSGNHNVTTGSYTGYGASSWGGDCAGSSSINLNPGDDKICIITFDDNSPPSPSCASTVIILDRRKITNLPEESNAAKGLLNLYNNLSPAPKVGVGSFGGYPSGAGTIPSSPSGHLTSIYGSNGTSATGLYNTINILSATASAPGIPNGNLIAGINAGSAELASEAKKALILISDGDPGGTQPNVLAAADAAKNSGAEIFTISVGTSVTSINKRPLMAYVATGNVTPTPTATFGTGHQPGSYYDPALSITQENADGDHFFITPTPAELTTIFQTIGATLCPAATIPPTPPPTTSHIIIITNVINDNGGSMSSGSFTSTVSAKNPSPTASPKGLSTGVSITVSPGYYSVDQSSVNGYTTDIDANCSGALVAGETKTCTITNDDTATVNIAPIAPPPLKNVKIGAWAELGT